MKPALLSLLLFLSITPMAQAHREDYSGSTLVFLTLHRGEVEPEYQLDFVSPRKGKSYFRQTLALEYGITERLMIDARVATGDNAALASSFGSAHIESRYRFGEEGSLPIDVAISAEVGWERDEDGEGEFEFEPRLILSKDLGKFNVTLNVVGQFLADGKGTLLANGGMRYNASEIVQLGSELTFNQRNGNSSVLPQIWFALPGGTTIKLGASSPLRHDDDRFLRLVLEREF